MKQILFTLIALFAISTVTFAQNVNEANVKAGIQKAKADTQNPKKSTKAATWIALGEELNSAATAASSSVFPGMPEAQVILVMGQPGGDGTYEIETINGKEYKKFGYPLVNLYIFEEKLEFWNETKEIYPNALDESYAAYKKAVEVDSKSTKKVQDGLKVVLNNYINSANNKYQLNNYNEAAKQFAEAAKIAADPLVASEDANVYKYYAGVAYIQGADYASAVPLFEEVANSGHLENGDTYYYLGFASEKVGNNDAAEAAYMKGMSEFPTNQKNLNQLINYYLLVKNDPVKVISLIKNAQENDPNNAILVFVEGLAYQNMKDFEKAHIAYDRVKSMDPKNFDAYYNDALAYISEADEKVQELAKTDATNRTAKEAITKAYMDTLKKTISVLEGALALNPENTDVMELIKTVSFRLRDEDPKYKELYDKYNEILKQ